MVDVDLNAPVNQSIQNRKDITSLFGTQRGETSDFLNRYTNFIGGQPSTSAIADRIGNELNLPTLQKNASMINKTISEIPNTYSGATRGFDVNNNQLNRIIGQKVTNLAPAQQSANTAVSDAQNSLNTRLGYETADRDRALLPFQSEQNFLGERLARETTGYSSAMQSELDAIISKMNAGITISEGEKNRANELAKIEATYQNNLKLNKQSQSQPNFASVNGGLFNTTSGQWAVKPPLGNFFK